MRRLRAFRTLIVSASRRTALAAAVVVALLTWLRAGPLPAGLLDLQETESTVVLDRHGEILYEARSGSGSRASWLPVDELTPSLVNATVAAEDRRYWHHPGVDPIAIVRAVYHDLRSRRLREGGSTITQQVAKALLTYKNGGTVRRGAVRKLREAILALRLEHRLSKREILALYLNIAPYGNQIVGAQRASHAYFGKSASLLTPAQAAFLAALPQRPSWFNPYRDPARARARQERVIVQMGLARALSPDAVREAMDERLSFEREPASFVAPHFVAHVLEIGAPGRTRSVTTTLDADLQRTVEGVIRAGRPSLDRYGAHNVAVVVLDNATGEWLAWEGSGNYADAAHGGTIDGVVTPRQPGSALKPFTYALAFEDGASPATALPDIPSFFQTAEKGVLYSPRNYDGRFRGPLLARTALAGSENVPAVALASRVGVPNLLRFLRTAGFSTFDKNATYYGVGLTLGDAEVRLDQLVAAYAAFARGGVAVQPTFVRSDRHPDTHDGDRLMSPRTAFWITAILSDDEARAFAFGRGGSLEFEFPVAAKTGTSQGYHDNWAIGYTRNVTVGVWVGNFDRRPLVGSSGVSGAGPIFHTIMLAAEERASRTSHASATSAQPEGTTRRAICALSGMAATPWCPAQVDEWTATDSSSEPCTWHRRTPAGVVVDWPVEYQAWARSEQLLDRVVAAPPSAGSMVTSAVTSAPHPVRVPSAQALRIVNPPDGAIYLIDPTLRREFQTLSLRATAGASRHIEWRIDGKVVGHTESSASLDWRLAPGRHVISARDTQGHQGEVPIVVK